MFSESPAGGFILSALINCMGEQHDVTTAILKLCSLLYISGDIV